jgi:hypothetical protein
MHTNTISIYLQQAEIKPFRKMLKALEIKNSIFGPIMYT